MLRVPCVTFTICFLQVPVILVAILREVQYNGYITKLLESMYESKLLNFIMHGLK
jgi:hypothetical protein